jgi:hypothetical protein
MAETAEKQFERFLSRYNPEIVKCATEAVAKMRKYHAGSAIELVYDNYNALVVGFGPTERASDALFSLALYPRWVTLFFLHGALLEDPEKLLKGDGKIVRHIVLKSAEDLERPAIRALMDQALKGAKVKFAEAPGQMVIKSISRKQRPRRPPAAKKAAIRE